MLQQDNAELLGFERVLQQASAHGNAHLELASGEHLWAARPEQKEDIEKDHLELAAGDERHQLRFAPYSSK
jgi:hypothetical protein